MKRSGVATVSLATGVALTVASVAWACTINMRGTIWFSRVVSGPQVSNAPAGSTVYSHAANLMSRNTDYEIRYVPLGNQSGLCHNSKLTLGPRTFKTDSTGGWSNQGVKLPTLRGTYAMCAATILAFEAGRETGDWSNHTTFSVV